MRHNFLLHNNYYLRMDDGNENKKTEVVNKKNTEGLHDTDIGMVFL